MKEELKYERVVKLCLLDCVVVCLEIGHVLIQFVARAVVSLEQILLQIYSLLKNRLGYEFVHEVRLKEIDSIHVDSLGGWHIVLDEFEIELDDRVVQVGFLVQILEVVIPDAYRLL